LRALEEIQITSAGAEQRAASVIQAYDAQGNHRTGTEVGRELGLLGIDPYIKRRPDLIKRAQAWIFFGSDIGAPRQPNLIHASDDALEQWAGAAMEKEGLTVNAKARHDSTARGETGVVQHGGGRFITLACESHVYHNVADRWPEAVDVSILARYARAFANGTLELTRQTG